MTHQPPKVIGYRSDKVETVVEVDGGRLMLIRRETHYTAEIVPSDAAAPAPSDQQDALIDKLEEDCRRWNAILRRCPQPGDYVRLKRSGQAARWFDVMYEKGVDQAPIKVTKTARGVEISHDAPKARRIGVSAEELDWMDAMMDVLLTLGWGTIGWLLVTGRAARRPWAELEQLDPERRGERHLRRLHRLTLINLLPVWLERVHKI